MHFVQLNEERKGSMGGTEIILPQPNRNDRSKRALNGHLLSGECQKQSHSFSLTKGRNYLSTLSTLKDSFQPSTLVLTPKSSYTINQCATKSEEARTSYSPTTNASAASVRQSCMPMESNTEEGEEGTPQKGETSPTKGNHRRKMSAEGSTLKVDAVSQRKNATISTPVKGAERLGMERPPV